MKRGDLVFVKNSALFKRTTPVILMEVYQYPRSSNTYIYVILDPSTGRSGEYQEHNLTEFPT